VIFGCGKGGEIVYRHLRRDSAHRILAFTLDREHLHEPTFQGLPVVDFAEIERHFPPDQASLFIALGFRQMNRLRAAKYAAGKAKGYRFISHVSPGSYWAEEPRIGENCLILGGQAIDLDVTIGHNVTIWSGNHIGDGCVIGDHVWLSSHVCLSGGVIVEPYAVFGNSCTISNGVRIRPGTFVGANSLLAKDTEENGVYLAKPAERAPLDSARFLAVWGARL
jgi:sugar O-acyltransferase (sialic acid O-acetyltransferase NeuD family)